MLGAGGATALHQIVEQGLQIVDQGLRRGSKRSKRNAEFRNVLHAVVCFRSRQQEPGQSGELQCDRHHECHRVGRR